MMLLQVLILAIFPTLMACEKGSSYPPEVQLDCYELNVDGGGGEPSGSLGGESQLVYPVPLWRLHALPSGKKAETGLGPCAADAGGAGAGTGHGVYGLDGFPSHRPVA